MDWLGVKPNLTEQYIIIMEQYHSGLVGFEA
jgi:hypothetical protein